jgi:hypothetical protein
MKDKKIVLFPAWKRVVPSDFEKWLEEMAAKGWHIDRIRQWSSMFMIFKKGKLKKYRYVYDLRAVATKDYISTYEQFGWEYLGRMASVYIWRMEYTDKRPEAFTDRESLAGRNNRTIAAISFSFTLFALGLITMALAIIFCPSSISGSAQIQLIVALIIFALAVITLGSVMIYIRKKSR